MKDWQDWQVGVAVYISEVEMALSKAQLSAKERINIIKTGQDLIFKSPN